MEAIRAVGDLGRPLHGDVLGQEGVGAAHPGVGRALQLGVKVHDLHQAVHTGIGATGADGGDFLSSKAAQGRFEFVLYGVAIGLALPAAIGLTVVADAKSYAHGMAPGAGSECIKSINQSEREGCEPWP
jgi:hypothetical protein